MSRAIPPVRRWVIKAYLDQRIAGTGDESILLAEIVVDAVNKRFARWAARDRMRSEMPERYLATNRISTALVPEGWDHVETSHD